MKIVKLFMVAVIALLVTSCGTTQKSNPYKISDRLEITMNDLQFLGESVITCEYSTYFGIFKHIEKVNGVDYMPGNDVKVNYKNKSLNFSNKGMRLAATKILQDYPDATYFQVVMETKQTDVLFLGSTTKRQARVRAYKFK